jgi:P-type Ca2+ transporter type 2C
MTIENLLVHMLGSCKTMANASVICADKTGTLTQNEMTVVAGSISIRAKFVRKLDENPARTGNKDMNRPNTRDFAIDILNLISTLTPQLVELLNSSMAINSTAFEDIDSKSGAMVFIGSKTESVLLKLAKDLGWANYKDIHDTANVILMIPFSSKCKSMGCVVRLRDGVHCLFLKGASKILMWKSTCHVIVHHYGANDVLGGSRVETVLIGDFKEDNISRTITFYASQTLCTIALCYCDLRSWPPKGTQLMDDGGKNFFCC